MINKDNTKINIMSFGYKYGLPEEANFLQDVRFLQNPYYVPELKEKTGLCPEVSSYVKDSEVTAQYLSKLGSFLDFYVKSYFESGKDSLTIAIGCTGGRHRSVTVAQEVYAHLTAEGYNAEIYHRDIQKDK